MSNLDVEQLGTLLSVLNGWQVQDGKLHKVFEFQDFAEAFAFMARVALVAEKADHHPDWSNSYRKVVIDLVTHSTGGITQKDIDLARTIDVFS
ncbi:MAG: 4a-hydroxytetrahydrobiopterin dehydratase [Thiolinea sp.]